MKTLNASSIAIRALQRRDLEPLQRLATSKEIAEDQSNPGMLRQQIQLVRRWYRLWQLLRLVPNPWQHRFLIYIAEIAGRVIGLIQVSPCNKSRSTWCVDQVVVTSEVDASSDVPSPAVSDTSSQLLQHCLQMIWEARTWVSEVDVNDKMSLALYRQTGFQPLAQITDWAIVPEQLKALAEHEPVLPNLLPISNADAYLLYQLDTVAMPPLVRQVFDRHIQDFKTSLICSLTQGIHQWLNNLEVVSGYVFEPQRKAAIGYFQLQLSRNPSYPHKAQLTVHPAYTWLYQELIAQMARIAQEFPGQALHLTSADYQPEREAYLEQIGAHRTTHRLLMSRSIWHKVRETKLVSLEALQIAEMLQGLQPSRKPVPGRIALQPPQKSPGTSTDYSHHVSHHDDHLSSRLRCR
jgi:hypothetical protein